MATYRLSVSIVKRSTGRSIIAAAAYRSATRTHDDRTEITHDYTRRSGVIHTDILTPEDAPSWAKDRNTLWNAVEHIEKRKDAQLAREVQISLPHELNAEQHQELVLSFVQSAFVDYGMIADIAIHSPDRQGDQRNHHAHILLTMRPLTKRGWGKKNRSWNDKTLIQTWRRDWASVQNAALQRAGQAARVDHRSLEAQGIDREPEPKLGPIATQMERAGRESLAGHDWRAVKERNRQRAEIEQQWHIITQHSAQSSFNAPRTSIKPKHHTTVPHAS